MSDKEFLEWILARMHYVHGENVNVDYMLKLQSIINAMDADTITPNTAASKAVK